MERTTIHLEAADRIAIEAIKRRYGLTSAAAAIRLALRMVAGEMPSGKRPEKK